MTLQLLVAAVNGAPRELAEKMRIDSDAIIVSQGERYAYETLRWKGHEIRCFHMAERGVGLSRNHSLLRATAEICLFADEDIIYEPGYEQKVLQAFEERPAADLLFFQCTGHAGAGDLPQ